MHNPLEQDPNLRHIVELPTADLDRLYFEETAVKLVDAAGLAAQDGVDLAGCGTADLPAALDALVASMAILPGNPAPAEDDPMRAAAVRVSAAYTAPPLTNYESLFIGTEKSTTRAELTFAVDMLRRGLAAVDGQG